MSVSFFICLFVYLLACWFVGLLVCLLTDLFIAALLPRCREHSDSVKVFGLARGKRMHVHKFVCLSVFAFILFVYFPVCLLHIAFIVYMYISFHLCCCILSIFRVTVK